ncbi:tyrosine-protein phosphatase non-receptor type 18 isoform X9 [Trachypithecus francoisi]|uniref:tyrosine-protein phosphatase non-receptor type 18 isoform X9 n=1 Tax=Trachypithecus francoisi TaxID=54180 RepID=UPI00141B2360|nr:tyrosine-protein phosphatase non-receptor type 18 isoform X9 [Trachypithecus francoisi]
MSRSLDAARSFLERLEARGGREGPVLAGEFSDIQARSAAWKADGMCSTKAGSRPENVRKNRYKDVLPYDHTRVILSLLQEEGHSDYINGNFIRVILMACREIENGQESRSVSQLQYMSWPDRGVPSSPDHMLAMVEEARRLQGSGPEPLCVHCSAGCGRTGVLCTVDYVRQLLLTQMIPPDFSLFDVVLEMRKQRPAAVQTEEQYRFLYHTVAQMFCSMIQNASLHYQNIKENCAPLYDDALFLRTPQALLAIPRPPGGVLRSISVHGSPGHAMADTYAVVQKRGAPAGAGPGTETGTGACSAEEVPLYSEETGRAQRPGAHAEDVRGTVPGHVPADQSPAASGAYEDVAGGAQTGGLCFNLRIGRPKGPRDPPAEWTRV